VLFEGTGNVLQESANLFWDNTNGRLGVNTSSPSFGLDVSGTARVSGNILSGSHRFGNSISNSPFLFSFVSDSGSPDTTGRNLALYSYSTASLGGAFAIAGDTISPTTGAHINFRLVNSFAPTSGTASMSIMQINWGINQTGGANGITRGIHVSPTLTSAFDFRAIETTVGKVCLNTTSGNTMIGTTTDAGFKVDVNGTLRVIGATTLGTTSASNITTIATNGSSNILNITNTAGTFVFGVDGAGGYAQPTTANRGMWFYNSSASAYIGAAANGCIAINTTSPNASAILDVVSTTKGFLAPRMTNAQRLAISSPAVGLLVYCTDLVEGFYVNKSTGWTFVI
jgi:hypothetical protein